jgi:hypothetical protein
MLFKIILGVIFFLTGVVVSDSSDEKGAGTFFFVGSLFLTYIALSTVIPNVAPDLPRLVGFGIVVDSEVIGLIVGRFLKKQRNKPV